MEKNPKVTFCEPKVYFVAHNGSFFDDILLTQAGLLVGEDLKRLRNKKNIGFFDSMHLFSSIRAGNRKIPNNRLETHARFSNHLGADEKQDHEAVSDVSLLEKCLKSVFSPLNPAAVIPSLAHLAHPGKGTKKIIEHVKHTSVSFSEALRSYIAEEEAELEAKQTKKRRIERSSSPLPPLEGFRVPSPTLNPEFNPKEHIYI